MKKASTTFDKDHLPGSFAGLSGIHMLRPIRDGVGLENAREIADALAVLDKRTADQEEYLESLSQLMEHYENSIAPPRKKYSPIEMLKYLMDANGMSESDLGRLLGERSMGNAIMSGRRGLSKGNIRVLADRFKVSTDLFF